MSENSPITELQSSTRKLVHDTVELAELQLQLFAADGSEMARKSAPPLFLMIAGVVIAISGLPLLLGALASALVKLVGFPVWLALITSTGAGLTIGGIAVYVGIKWLQPQLTIWQRSAGELKKNVEFLKGTLRDAAPDARGANDNASA